MLYIPWLSHLRTAVSAHSHPRHRDETPISNPVAMQNVFFAEATPLVGAPPADLPYCPETCPLQFAPWELPYVDAKWGSSGYQLD